MTISRVRVDTSSALPSKVEVWSLTAAADAVRRACMCGDDESKRLPLWRHFPPHLLISLTTLIHHDMTLLFCPNPLSLALVAGKEGCGCGTPCWSTVLQGTPNWCYPISGVGTYVPNTAWMRCDTISLKQSSSSQILSVIFTLHSLSERLTAMPRRATLYAPTCWLLWG